MNSFTFWIIKLKHVLFGLGIIKSMNQKIDYSSWKYFYDNGYTPLEAIFLDINEQ
jgi:hypothetical protein